MDKHNIVKAANLLARIDSVRHFALELSKIGPHCKGLEKRTLKLEYNGGSAVMDLTEDDAYLLMTAMAMIDNDLERKVDKLIK